MLAVSETIYEKRSPLAGRIDNAGASRFSLVSSFSIRSLGKRQGKRSPARDDVIHRLCRSISLLLSLSSLRHSFSHPLFPPWSLLRSRRFSTLLRTPFPSLTFPERVLSVFLPDDPVPRRGRPRWEAQTRREHGREGKKEREREREKERNRRSEQRKITTVNGTTTVQRNASEHEDISQVCLAPLCRYGAPANIYSYDNRYAAAGYLNSDAANPAFRRFAPTPASARGRPLFSRELPRLSYFVSHFPDRFTVSTNFCYLLRFSSSPLFRLPASFFFFLVILNFRRVFFSENSSPRNSSLRSLQCTQSRYSSKR